MHEVFLFIIVLHHADIKEEAIDSRAEVKSFDHSKLKHVKTEEKVTLPGAGGLYLWILFSVHLAMERWAVKD